MSFPDAIAGEGEHGHNRGQRERKKQARPEPGPRAPTDDCYRQCEFLPHPPWIGCSDRIGGPAPRSLANRSTAFEYG